MHVVGWLLVGEAAVMTVPAMADALVDSPDWTAFILSAFITVGVGGALVLASDDYGAWGGFSTVAFFALFFVGGCTGSTSGSIKIFRCRCWFSRWPPRCGGW